MRYNLSTLLLTALFLVSCGAANEAKRAAALDFYGKMQAAMVFYHDQQQLFIDKSTQAIFAIQSGGKPDTKELRSLLDSAIDGNRSRYNMIVNIPEVDEEIGYKQKLLDYVEVFNTAYSKEFKDFIAMVESDMTVEEKGDHMEKHLKPKLLLIKEKEKAMLEAKEKMQAKYDLYEVDGLMEKVNDHAKDMK